MGLWKICCILYSCFSIVLYILGNYIDGTRHCGNEFPSNQTFNNVGALRFISDGIGQYQGFSVYVDFLGMSVLMFISLYYEIPISQKYYCIVVIM